MPTEAMSYVIKWLAIIGGGVVGGLLVGWLVRMLVLMFTTRQLPKALHWIFRLLGAILVGWLTWLYVFGGGGTGLGGPGGSGTGTDSSRPVDDIKDKKPTDSKDSVPGVTEKGEQLTIEVLGNPDLARLKPSATVDPDHCYRFAEGDGKLLTLDEVKRIILDRQPKTPPLRRIILTLYRDTPAPQQKRVSALKDWTEQLPVVVDGKTLMKDGKDVLITVKLDPNPDKVAPLK
jgi:hypothetical protein